MNRLLNEPKKDKTQTVSGSNNLATSTSNSSSSSSSNSGNDGVISLIMRSKSPHLQSVIIRCSITLEINDIAQTYCHSQNISIYNVRFYYNNRRLRIANDDTIKSLNVKEGDEIQVVYVSDF